MKSIIIDLDGTLCDCSHRVHWAQAKQWDEFHAGIPEDKPNQDVVALLDHMSHNHCVILCTGRNERNRNATEKWLRDYNLHQHIDTLLMRPDKVNTSDHELKVQMVKDYFEDLELNALEEVLFVLDDRDRVVEAFRDAGFRCWQVQAGSY